MAMKNKKFIMINDASSSEDEMPSKMTSAQGRPPSVSPMKTKEIEVRFEDMDACYIICK
jgi:hypothetical protein